MNDAKPRAAGSHASRHRSTSQGLRRSRCGRRSRSPQRGVMLIEVLIATLIFLIGVLGLVAAQAAAIRHQSDAQYRSEAMLLADTLIARMWVWSPATRATAFDDPAGSAYVAWRDNEVIPLLPGSSSDAPTVVFDAANPRRVTVTVFWKHPAGPVVNRYVATAEINQ